MRLFLVIVALGFGASQVSALINIPLDQMTCSGPFQDSRFFDGLDHRADLNPMISELGRDPTTFYKFELMTDVYVRPPSFFVGPALINHKEEYVFLSKDEQGLSISRFALLNLSLRPKKEFVLLAQSPVEVDEANRILQYRAIPPRTPDWTCRY